MARESRRRRRRACQVWTRVESTGSASAGSTEANQLELSLDPGAVLPQQLSQNRSVTARLVIAIAADGKVSVPRQRGQEIEKTRGRRTLHLGPVSSDEPLPATTVPRGERNLHELVGWSQLRKPDVVEVPFRVFGLRHAARWTPDRPHPQTFALVAQSAELDHADSHHADLAAGARSSPCRGPVSGRDTGTRSANRLFSGRSSRQQNAQHSGERRREAAHGEPDRLVRRSPCQSFNGVRVW